MKILFLYVRRCKKEQSVCGDTERKALGVFLRPLPQTSQDENIQGEKTFPEGKTVLATPKVS